MWRTQTRVPCHRAGVIEVSKSSSQDRMLQRTVEQTLDESCVPRERVQQRTANHIDDAPQFLEEVVEMERLAQDKVMMSVN